MEGLNVFTFFFFFKSQNPQVLKFPYAAEVTQVLANSVIHLSTNTETWVTTGVPVSLNLKPLAPVDWHVQIVWAYWKMKSTASRTV